MTHLDYSYKQYYPKWERGNDENLIASLKKDYIEIILYKQSICDKVNEVINQSITIKGTVSNIKDYYRYVYFQVLYGLYYKKVKWQK